MKRFFFAIIMMVAAVTASLAATPFTYWGYCDKNIAGEYSSMAYGKAAIYIPAEVAQKYVGHQVTGVRVGLADATTSLSVFVKTSLDGNDVASQQAETNSKGWNIVRFDNAYTITGEGFYVGYEFSGSTTALGCSLVRSQYANYTNDGSGWVDNSADASNPDKALSIWARIEGEDLPVDLGLIEVNDIAVKGGLPFTIKGRVMNLSASKVDSYRLGYSIDGGTEEYADIDASLAARSEGEFNIEHAALEASGKHTLKVRIVSADGEADAYEGNNSREARLLMSSVSAVKRVVMEEYTGLYCGYCPRGIVGIETMIERYPDNFIAVAKHCYSYTPDELKSPTYDYEISGGFPKCIIDRRWQCDPGPSNVSGYVLGAKNQGTVVGLDADAAFTSEESTQVSVDAIAQFLVDKSNANYRFAFALIENDVYQPDGTKYTQANSYAGKSTEMGGFESLPSKAPIVLQHVARSGYHVKDGIEGSIPTSVSSSYPVSYRVTLDVPSTVNKPENLRLIVYILDKSTGYIENACDVAIKAGSGTGISETRATVAPDLTVVDGRIVAEGFDGQLSIYSADGTQVANGTLRHGVYVVKGTSGKSKFVKKIAL